jgi:hypothetical protein
LDTVDFLRHVLPRTGPYCLAIQKTTTNKVWHLSAETISDAAALAKEQDEREDCNVFFAVGTLIKAKAWDDAQQRFKTSRTGDNIRGCQSYTMDIDAGLGRAYGSVELALAALISFTKQHHLPKPTVVNSGGGLHVYWTLTEEVPQAEWEANGRVLSALAATSGLLHDSARSTDSSSVLRVVGCRNYKYDAKPIVSVLCVGAHTPVLTFHRLIGVQGVAPALPPQTALVTLNSNLGDLYDRDSLSAKKAFTRCRVLGFIGNPENQKHGRERIPEPAWFAALSILTHCKNGRQAAHDISKSDPRYTTLGTDERFDRFVSKGMGPASCASLQKSFKDVDVSWDGCSGCPYFDKITSPAVIAHRIEQLPDPVVFAVGSDGLTQEIVVPALPADFMRTPKGIELRTVNLKTGVDDSIVVLPYDMYPKMLTYDEHSGLGHHITWMVNYPQIGWQERDIPITTKAQLAVTLAKYGIHIDEPNTNLVGNFMTSYVRRLQADARSAATFSKFGWHEGRGFVLGERLIHPDGTVSPAAMSDELREAAQDGVHCKGSVITWTQELTPYARDGLEPYRMEIYVPFASILYPLTGEKAMTIGASGRGGVGKSTVMDVAASVWGEPDALVTRGTKDGHTRAAAEILANAMHHLPVFFDEITGRDAKELSDFIFNYTGGKGKIRSKSGGGIRQDTATWSNICSMNMNSDVYAEMTASYRESDPHMMRFMQIEFPQTNIISKAEGDRIKAVIRENYGHAGFIFARYVAMNREAVRARVKEKIATIDINMGGVSKERYWTAGVACIMVAAEIASSLGLLPNFPVHSDCLWLYELLKTLRVMTVNNETPAGEMIAEFLDSELFNTLTISAKASNNIDNIAREPRGELNVRFEADNGVAYISKAALTKFCRERGFTLSRKLTDLKRDNILLQYDVLKVLGAGTNFAKGRVKCIEVDVSKLGGKLALIHSTAPVVSAPASAAAKP